MDLLRKNSSSRCDFKFLEKGRGTKKIFEKEDLRIFFRKINILNHIEYQREINISSQ